MVVRLDPWQNIVGVGWPAPVPEEPTNGVLIIGVTPSAGNAWYESISSVYVGLNPDENTAATGYAFYDFSSSSDGFTIPSSFNMQKAAFASGQFGGVYESSKSGRWFAVRIDDEFAGILNRLDGAADIRVQVGLWMNSTTSSTLSPDDTSIGYDIEWHYYRGGTEYMFFNWDDGGGFTHFGADVDEVVTGSASFSEGFQQNACWTAPPTFYPPSTNQWDWGVKHELSINALTGAIGGPEYDLT